MTITKFKPLNDNILIKRAELENKTPHGIIIPDTVKEKPLEGIVIEVGSGTRDDNGNLKPLDIKVGDKVMFTKWGGKEITINGEEFLIVKESDILGRFI